MRRSEKLNQVQRILWIGFVICAMLGVVYLLATMVRSSAAFANATLASAAAEYTAGQADAPSAYPGVTFDPTAQANFGQPTEFVTHTTFLENQTNNADSFTLEMAPGYVWNATLSPTQTAVLTNGERTPFTVVVEVPAGTAVGEMDSLEVIAFANNQFYTNTTTLDTAVICDPYLDFRGTSAEEIDILDDTYQYAGQRFAYLLIRLNNSPYYYSINATISGYNPDSDSWDVIAEQLYGPAGLPVHQTLIPPTYTKIRVQMDDGDSGYGWVWYDYQFALCREPAVDLRPLAQEAYVQPGETAVYSQTLTNWTMSSSAFTLTAAGSAWPVTFWHEGSQISETAVLDDLDAFTYTVQVVVPASVDPGAVDGLVVWATAVASPTIQNSAVITTYVTGDLAYVTLSASNLVAVVDSANNVVIDTIDVGAAGCSFPWRAAITPDGGQVYVSCRYSNNVMVIDSNTFAISHIINSVAEADGIAFRRDGQYAFLGSRWTDQIVAVNTTNYFQLAIPVNGDTRSLAAHPFLDLIYATSSAGEILVLDAVSFTVVDAISVNGEPWDVAVSPDGQRLYTGDRWGAGLTVIDLNTNSVLTTLTGLGNLTGLDIAPDAATLYASALYDGIRVIDTATLTEVTTVYVNGPAWETAVTCDGSQLYVGSTENFVPIIDTAAYTVSQLPMPGYGARGIAICPQYVGSGIILTPAAQEKQGVPGQTLVYETTLRNETGQTDTFTLTLGASLWDSVLSGGSVGPLADGTTATFALTVTIPAGADWYDTDVVAVTATSITSPTVYSDTAVFASEAYAPPQISVMPDSLSHSQAVNSVMTETAVISNGNGVTLTFSIYAAGSGAGGSLETTLDSLNANYQTIINAIPNRYDFSEGETGYSISDGGGDMYDVGNYLATNLGGFIEYANDVIVSGTEFGVDGRYFTRKYPGLFVLAADMMGVDYFEISGNLGADGYGYADGTVLQIQHYGTTYYGFVKRVYSAGDPSVNHLIIVPANPAAAHEYATNTNDDYHRVFNLSTSTRLYYLLYAGSNGYYIDDDDTLNIMQAFLNTLPADASSLWLTAAPVTGTLPTNGTQDIIVTFDTTAIQPGTYQGALSIGSNDPVNGRITIPIALTAEPTASMGWVEGYVTDSRFGAPLQAAITAQGQPYTITAGLDGFYKLWLEAGSYTLQVAADGYVSQTLPVIITAQQATLQDVALVENVPVLNLAPDSIDVTQDVGDVTYETMTLNNDGPAAMTFAIEERDTTPGLSLLSAYARTNAEMDALRELPTADAHNEGAPTVAPIPVSAFSELQGTTNLLAWIKYTDYDQEYENTLNAIAQYTTFNLTETDTEDPTVLAGLLAVADVFLVPEQENIYGSYLYDLGINWANVLDAFVNRGGVVVVMDSYNQTYQLLEGAGLMDIQTSYYSNYYWLEIVDPQHSLAQDVPSPFYGLSTLAFYDANNVDVVVKRQGYNDSTVLAKDVGSGHVALIGFDYYTYNDEMARIAANAAQWYSSDVPWLATTPVTGTVTGYDALTAQVTLDASGLQPGLYTANLIVNTNDPYTPTQVLPVSMAVQATASMGQVVGAISDAWTDSPLTATVQLQGVYTMTADPTYGIWAEAGEHTLTAFAAGYMTETVTVVIPAGGVVTQDLALVPAQPRLEGMPESVSLTAVSGFAAIHNFTLSNTGPLPLDYAWHEISATNRSPVTPVDLTGKSILLDMSHGSGGLSSFYEMAQDITDAGGMITEVFLSPITAAVLAPHDVLWVNCCGYMHWTTDELTAVANWLAAGGAIFLHGGDSYGTQDLANLFDIQYIYGSYYGGTTTNVLPHPTTAGVGSVFINYAPNALTYTQAADVLVYDLYDYPVAVAQEQNGGRIVVISDETFFDYVINNADNRLFALNIMNWLADPVYTDVLWVSVSPVTGTISAYANQDYALTADATNLPPGTYDMLMVLEHNDPAQGPAAYLPVTLEVVARTAAVSAATDETMKTAVPGHSATYHVLITNDGNAPDSFTLAADGIWNAALSAGTTGELAVGESFMLTVTVTVPDAAAGGDADVTTLTVTSDAIPSVNAGVTLTTTADLLQLYLPIVR